MAKTADVLLMNICFNEHENAEHRFAATTASIINLLNNGELDDDAIVNLLLNYHHHQQRDKVQQAARLLAVLCFNRLITLRAFNEQLKKIKEETKDFIRTFCLEFGKFVQ
jgi:intergrase/recombinase